MIKCKCGKDAVVLASADWPETEEIPKCQECYLGKEKYELFFGDEDGTTDK